MAFEQTRQADDTVLVGKKASVSALIEVGSMNRIVWIDSRGRLNIKSNGSIPRYKKTGAGLRIAIAISPYRALLR